MSEPRDIQLIHLNWRDSCWYAWRFLLHVMLGGRLILWVRVEGWRHRLLLEAHEPRR